MVSPLSVNEKPKVASRRRHLRPEEAAKLIVAAGKRGRYPDRDRLLLRLAYRHGLRASEAVGLRWDSLDMTTAEKYAKGILDEQSNRPKKFQEAVTVRVPSDDVREEAMAAKLTNLDSGTTTLVICGYLHFESLAKKLREKGHAVDKRVYLETVPKIESA